MRRPCSVANCERPHSAKGYCRMHYRRWKATGDPLRKSRFSTPEEKQAFIASDIKARRERRVAEREEREHEREVWLQHNQVLADFGPRRSPIRPAAVALVEALDRLPESERVDIASALVVALTGRSVALGAPARHETRTHTDAPKGPASEEPSHDHPAR